MLVDLPWRQLSLFTLVAYGLAVLSMLPFHLGMLPFEGLWVTVLAAGMMWAPTLATVVVVATLDRGERWWMRVGLGVPGGRWGLFIGVLALAWVGPVILNTLAPLLIGALGGIELDLAGFSGFRAVLEEQLEGTGMTVEMALGGLPLWAVVALQPVNGLVGAVITMVLGAFGEELGWRGWLQPKLAPLGRFGAYVAVGTIWGLWHAPIILLGYNYPTAPVLGVFLFVPFCIAWSALLGWTRDVTGSVWPAALGHGAINASAGTVVAFLAADFTLDTVWHPPVGIFMVLFLLPFVLLVGLGLALRRRTAPEIV